MQLHIFLWAGSIVSFSTHAATTFTSTRVKGALMIVSGQNISTILSYNKTHAAVAAPQTDWRRGMMRIQVKHKLAAIAIITLSFNQATPVHAQSAADCAARAERAERGSSGVMTGAAVGAAGGAVFGAIVGDNRKAAKRGAVLGAVAGGANNAYRKNEAYKREYDACMAGY